MIMAAHKRTTSAITATVGNLLLLEWARKQYCRQTHATLCLKEMTSGDCLSRPETVSHWLRVPKWQVRSRACIPFSRESSATTEVGIG